MTIDKIFPKFKQKYRQAMVTGGAGFIGSHICEELATRGFPVISIDNYVAGKKINLKHLKKYRHFQEVNCDVTNYKKLQRYFKGVDVVFHNAASKKAVCLKDPRLDLAVNGAGTLNMVGLATKNKIKKFIHASTGSVYGEPQYFPTDEKHPTNPVSYYGVSKLAGEKYVQLFRHSDNLDTTILRYFHVYGQRQEFNEFGGVIPIFIRRCLENKPPIIFGTGEQQRTFTFVKDVVKANLLVAISPKATGEIYNNASSIQVTISELCSEVLKYFNRPKIKPIYQEWAVGDIRKINVDNSKIRKIGMDYETDFKAMLHQIIDEIASYIVESNKLKNKKALK